MKKITYALLFAFALSITACTEEEVAPDTQSEGIRAGTVSGGSKGV